MAFCGGKCPPKKPYDFCKTERLQNLVNKGGQEGNTKSELPFTEDRERKLIFGQERNIPSCMGDREREERGLRA